MAWGLGTIWRSTAQADIPLCLLVVHVSYLDGKGNLAPQGSGEGQDGERSVNCHHAYARARTWVLSGGAWVLGVLLAFEQQWVHGHGSALLP